MLAPVRMLATFTACATVRPGYWTQRARLSGSMRWTNVRPLTSAVLEEVADVLQLGDVGRAIAAVLHARVGVVEGNWED